MPMSPQAFENDISAIEGLEKHLTLNILEHVALVC